MRVEFYWTSDVKPSKSGQYICVAKCGFIMLYQVHVLPNGEVTWWLPSECSWNKTEDIPIAWSNEEIAMRGR